jgi:hypothetical protein
MTGTKARHTISFASTAERRADVKIRAKRNTAGLGANLVMGTSKN